MIIKFDKNLYSKKALAGAMKAYKELASIKLSETKNYFLVELDKIDKDVRDIIQDEFSNYILFLMKK